MASVDRKRHALVAGATGLVGGLLVRQLLDSDAYERVTVLTRRKVAIAHSRLGQILSDYQNLEADLAEAKFDDVFCCLGTTMKKAGDEQRFREVDHDYPLQIARITKRQGTRHFLVITAMGADRSSLFFYNRVKGELEKDLKFVDFPYLSIFRPSLLMGERDDLRPLESVSNQVLGLISPFMKGPLLRVKPISAEKVAKAMLHEALAVAQGQREPGVQIIDSASMQELPVNQ